MSVKLRQDRSEFNVLFVHSALDDYGLDAQEFRIYAHLARRANGKSRAYPGITSMSESCRMNRHTVLRVINSLEERRLIRIVKRFGRKNEYILTPQSEWNPPEPTSAVSGTGASNDTGTSDDTSAQVGTGACGSTGINPGTGAVPQIALPPVSKEALKGNPKKGNPFKDNTVEGRFSEQNPLPPGGRPPRGGPAMNGQHAGAESNPVPHKSAQSPIERKAYAITELLQFHHWDNCKISFAKHTARSYAEKALRDGHDELAILKAYETALKYCHGVATDEICRGERHQLEKASPALTVWLSRERLSGDPRTLDDRWEVIIAKLTTAKRKAIEEEAKILQEIAGKTPAINAWFNKKSNGGTHMSNRKSSPDIEP